jgi:hypothetical protein
MTGVTKKNFMLTYTEFHDRSRIDSTDSRPAPPKEPCSWASYHGRCDMRCSQQRSVACRSVVGVWVLQGVVQMLGDACTYVDMVNRGEIPAGARPPVSVEL